MKDIMWREEELRCEKLKAVAIPHAARTVSRIAGKFSLKLKINGVFVVSPEWFQLRSSLHKIFGGGDPSDDMVVASTRPPVIENTAADQMRVI